MKIVQSSLNKIGRELMDRESFNNMLVVHQSQVPGRQQNQGSPGWATELARWARIQEIGRNQTHNINGKLCRGDQSFIEPVGLQFFVMRKWHCGVPHINYLETTTTKLQYLPDVPGVGTPYVR